MKDIIDLKIVGIDEHRPPKIQKAPYIELYFKLNKVAPKDWCKSFNDLVAKGKYPIKINPEKGQFIETWVRTPEEVEPAFNAIKANLKLCIEQYIAKINAQTQASNKDSAQQTVSPLQARLNEVVAGLKFDKPDE